MRNNAIMKWSMVIALMILFMNAPASQNGLQPESQNSAPDSPLLSLEDKANLSEVLRLQEELGEELWPGFGRANIPIILYNERYEFLIGETALLSPWIVVEGDSFGGKPYYRRNSFHPQAFATRVGNVWAGSMSSLEMMNRKGPMKLARESYVLFVHHEMFHAYQAVRAEEHFRQAEKVYAAEGRYPAKEAEFITAWDKEGALLAAALNATDDVTLRRTVHDFLQVRDARRAQARLTPDLLAFERELEWLEGLAKYIELRLYDLACARRSDPAYSSYRPASYWRQADMFRLAKRLGHQDGDLRFYLSGMAQARLLDVMSPGWKEKVMRGGVYLEDLLRAALK